jgi:hypothetical protein
MQVGFLMHICMAFTHSRSFNSTLVKQRDYLGYKKKIVEIHVGLVDREQH